MDLVVMGLRPLHLMLTGIIIGMGWGARLLGYLVRIKA